MTFRIMTPSIIVKSLMTLLKTLRKIENYILLNVTSLPIILSAILLIYHPTECRGTFFAKRFYQPGQPIY